MLHKSLGIFNSFISLSPSHNPSPLTTGAICCYLRNGHPIWWLCGYFTEEKSHDSSYYLNEVTTILTFSIPFVSMCLTRHDSVFAGAF